MLFEKREKGFAHFWKAIASSRGRIAQESVATALVRSGFAAGFLLMFLRPKVFPALRTELPHETLFLKEGKRVLFRWKPFQFSRHSVRSASAFIEG
jgi:hypothetical protein